ncbi:MAG: hypothetical protein JWO53_1139, partial [Chlamydiia bacterium]|nr:hypothetical protein [Chlamydiia bacterium]
FGIRLECDVLIHENKKIEVTGAAAVNLPCLI